LGTRTQSLARLLEQLFGHPVNASTCDGEVVLLYSLVDLPHAAQVDEAMQPPEELGHIESAHALAWE